MSSLEEIVNSFDKSKSPSKKSNIGKILIYTTGGVALGLTILSAPFVSPALRRYCLPFIPATNEQLTNILIALKGKRGTLLDLGSGDGRIVIETAKKNFISHGVELNPWLVLYSKFSALKNGCLGKVKFYRQDLWKFKISPYDNIVIFGVEQMMKDLEKKFIEECNPNCNIIACRFPLPNLTPKKTIGHGIDTVWVYSLEKK